jgi:methionyl-tRNA synthetase
VSLDCGNFFSSPGNQFLKICFLCRKLHQQFEMYKEQVKKMGEESQQQQEQKGDAPTCGICHKTKFADGCGHNCSYCQTKFCARCGGRVSLRSNKVQKQKPDSFLIVKLIANKIKKVTAINTEINKRTKTSAVFILDKSCFNFLWNLKDICLIISCLLAYAFV